MKNSTKYIPLLLGIAAAIGIFIGGKLNFTDNSDRIFATNSKKDKLNRLIDYIDYEYVEDVNTDSIVDVTVNGILSNLDPHSVYIPKENAQKVRENMKGDFVGVGISFYTYRDTVTVIRSLKNGPSAKAGIKGGDRVITVNGDTIINKGLNNDALVNKIKGPIDSYVTLGVFRKSTNQFLNFKLKRSTIPLKSVDASYMLSQDLGYIKLNRFAESSYKEFITALRNLKSNGAQKLVLDLRDNPGGFVGIANEIVDEFLEEDKLILYTKNKKNNIEKSFATDKGIFENGHVYVLINENSASASEILAGALQDNDKGTIVGRRSYGKGLVQREMQLGDGSAVRLTVSKYYTPTGRSIQRAYEKGNTDYFDDYYNRRNSGELTDETKIEVADSLKFTTPKGKIVYGGGGIIPDVFVPIDKGMNNQTLEFIEKRGLTSNFVFELLEENREAFSNYTQKDFVLNYAVEDNIVKKFERFLQEKTQSNIVFVAYREEVKHYIKANIAEQLFGDEAYNKVLSKYDNMIEKVLLIENPPEIIEEQE